ncbi:unnamed protein product [Vicia faba]|uniref:Uncharacterized protein n=1 Tax=Vicia faba TaxID=3906 RepID=A0AAV0YHH7_VICFA|nr:unnamed protein product [Vicia faba]
MQINPQVARLLHNGSISNISIFEKARDAAVSICKCLMVVTIRRQLVTELPNCNHDQKVNTESHLLGVCDCKMYIGISGAQSIAVSIIIRFTTQVGIKPISPTFIKYIFDVITYNLIKKHAVRV